MFLLSEVILTSKNHTGIFKKILVEIISEAEAKVGAKKGEQTKVRGALRIRLDKMRTIFIINA